MSRSVSAVSMARSEYCRCPPRLPTPTASQVAIASGANHTVIRRAGPALGRMPANSRRGILSCTLGALSTSCRDHAPAVATMARRSIVAHRGRGIRAPTPCVGAAQACRAVPVAGREAPPRPFRAAAVSVAAPTTRSRGTSPPHRPPSSRHRCRVAPALADPSNRHASVLLHRCAQKYHDRPR